MLGAASLLLYHYSVPAPNRQQSTKATALLQTHRRACDQSRVGPPKLGPAHLDLQEGVGYATNVVLGCKAAHQQAAQDLAQLRHLRAQAAPLAGAHVTGRPGRTNAGARPSPPGL